MRRCSGSQLAYRNTAFVEPIEIESVGNGTYNGLQSVFRKRMGHGLDLQVAYTWSHAIDDAADPLVAPAATAILHEILSTCMKSAEAQTTI